MFLAAATAPGIEGAIHWQTVLLTVQEHTVPSAASGTMHQKERGHLGEPCLPSATVFPSGIPLHDRSDILFRGFAANLIPIIVLTTVCGIW